MFNNVSFIGGIHGVGKSTVCHQICNILKLQYLSASELIKWKDLNEDTLNKKVNDIELTQDKLITSLRSTIKENVKYILDGHYCLFNSASDVSEIPLKTFKTINPTSLNLIIGEITEIKSDLEKRDKRFYNYDLLNQLQESEIKYANKLSTILGITLTIGTRNDFTKILMSIQKTL